MNLKQSLSTLLLPSEIKKLTRAYDIIGDIAVVSITPGLERYENEIAQAILAIHKNVRVIFKRDGTCSGDHRTIPLAHLAGPIRTETTSKEFGVKLLLDLEKVYYSVRLAGERKRIAEAVQPDEHVLVMFSGVAPYPLMIAKFSEAASITGIEVNLVAHSYGMINLELNKANNIELIHGDVRSKITKTNRKYDRIVMPLPYRSKEFLNCAVNALLPGGTLHLYVFDSRDNFDELVLFINEQVIRSGRTLISSTVTLCGHNSPTSYRVCVDAVVT